MINLETLYSETVNLFNIVDFFETQYPLEKMRFDTSNFTGKFLFRETKTTLQFTLSSFLNLKATF